MPKLDHTSSSSQRMMGYLASLVSFAKSLIMVYDICWANKIAEPEDISVTECLSYLGHLIESRTRWRHTWAWLRRHETLYDVCTQNRSSGWECFQIEHLYIQFKNRLGGVRRAIGIGMRNE